jgi:hypothetical protein
MRLGVRLFVGTVFTVIGLSFLATTAVLIWEFWRADWLTLASFYSHLFLFFPTFGIVTLLAFYTPACVLTDMYFKAGEDRIKAGKTRFIIGFVVLVAGSLLLSNMMTGAGERSIFEVEPDLLRLDRGEPDNCAERGDCRRLPILVAIENVRNVSQTRIGLSDLARNCRPDALKDPVPAIAPARRYCFASTPLPPNFATAPNLQRVTDEQCCQAQRLFTEAVRDLHGRPGGASLTGKVHTWLLPFKIFFALVLVTISVLLAFRRTRMEKHYGAYLSGIERGVLIGAAAMIVFPVMSHAFLQSAALVYFGGGPSGGYRSIAPLFSFALGVWGLILLFYFYRRQEESVQNLARMGGIVGSGIAVVKYDQIIDFFVRIFGSGASHLNVALLCLAAFAAAMLLLTWMSQEEEQAAQAPEEARSGGAPSTPAG